MALAAAFVAPSAHADSSHADSPRYRYVALDQVPLPAPYTSFNPSTVVDGRVIGTVFDDSFSIGAVAVYDHGTITIGPAGIAAVGDETGLIGGSTLSAQAALFDRGVTTVIPPAAGELFANVVSLGDDHLALVSSTNSSFVANFAYYHRGTESFIDFGLPDPVFGAFMNHDGMIGVTKEESASDHFLHGYRYSPRTQKSTLLPPFAADPTDINVIIQGINDRGDVLGYSFTDFASPNYHERVGVWGHAGVFQPYFEETIVTNTLLFNNANQIVITNSSDSHSYLVPQPGTRLDLASIVSNVPAGLGLVQVVSIDDGAEITGYAADPTLTNFYPFLLEPMGDGDHDGGPVHPGHCVPWRISHQSFRWHPHK
jgi:hypothetical protein